MEGQLGLSEMSVISWVSAVEGYPLSEILLYWGRLWPVASRNNATENTVIISMYQYAYYVHHSHLSLHSVIIVYEWIGQHFSTLGGNEEAGVVCTQVSTDHVQQSWKQHFEDKNNEEGNDWEHFTF